MIDGYFLRGVQGDSLLVFRTDDPEEIFNIIRRLCATRDKDLKALAERLERDWFEQYTRDNGVVRPIDTKKVANSARIRSTKTKTSKSRSNPST